MTEPSHAAQCAWHMDQYDFECDCGAARPATLDWAERELSAAKDRYQSAFASLTRAHTRFVQMRFAARQAERAGK